MDTCRKLGVLFAACSPICRGALSGVFDRAALEEDDIRHSLPIFHEENWSHNSLIIQSLADFAKLKKCTLPQLALAWLAKQEVAMVVGMRSPKRVGENAASLEVILSDNDLLELDKISPVAGLRGARYPAEKMALYGMTPDVPTA